MLCAFTADNISLLSLDDFTLLYIINQLGALDICNLRATCARLREIIARGPVRSPSYHLLIARIISPDQLQLLGPRTSHVSQTKVRARNWYELFDVLVKERTSVSKEEAPTVLRQIQRIDDLVFANLDPPNVREMLRAHSHDISRCTSVAQSILNIGYSRQMLSTYQSAPKVMRICTKYLVQHMEHAKFIFTNWPVQINLCIVAYVSRFNREINADNLRYIVDTSYSTEHCFLAQMFHISRGTKLMRDLIETIYKRDQLYYSQLPAWIAAYGYNDLAFVLRSAIGGYDTWQWGSIFRESRLILTFMFHAARSAKHQETRGVSFEQLVRDWIQGMIRAESSSRSKSGRKSQTKNAINCAIDRAISLVAQQALTLAFDSGRSIERELDRAANVILMVRAFRDQNAH